VSTLADERAIEILEAGGVVCIPTESSYGLAAAIDGPGVERIAELKGRPEGEAFALIVADEEQARSVSAAWPERAATLAARHWPGPLTLVLPARCGLSPLLVGPGGGVGLRVSSFEATSALARALGRPITATSANPSGAAPATTVERARAYFGERVEHYIDGGSCEGTPSTVVEVLADGALRVLRPGAIPLP
jgi:L-threonylcarbamoyladenylate synthase